MPKPINDEDQDYLSITEARRKLPSLPDRLRDAPGAIAVTKREKPVLAIMPWDLYESIIETLEIMGDAELMDALRQGIKDVEEGRIFTMEEIERELKL
ncbi:MAG: type II toxin-antitoxin system Phd/YefM family antitoxin [Thermoleophilia bacterium]|nr:type II toxin-antitoxin system Phd/YefM family antitoxin [Thermoleophilia bacterium]